MKWNFRSQGLPVSERTTIFNATEKQVGLALVERNMPVPVLVIEHVNENPTPNVRPGN